MDAKQARAGAGPPKSKNEKGALPGAHLHGTTNTLQKTNQFSRSCQARGGQAFPCLVKNRHPTITAD
jgi:hypothetical protein